MKAISLWQPWAWAITHAGKDVENRTWPTRYRGPLLIHAAKRRNTEDEIKDFIDLLKEIYDAAGLMKILPVPAIPHLLALPKGGIVGKMNVVGCRRGVESPWAFKEQFQWSIEDAKPLPFKAYSGERGFFEVDYDGIVEPQKRQLELL